MKMDRGCGMRDAKCRAQAGEFGSRVRSPSNAGLSKLKPGARAYPRALLGAIQVSACLVLLVYVVGCSGPRSETPANRAAAVEPTGPPVDTEPYALVTPYLTLPPFLEERVVFYHSFSTDDADLNNAGLLQAAPVARDPDGFCGPCARLADKKGLTVSGPALSPHAPITISFWWAIEEPLEENGGIGFFALRNNGRGYISNFVRGGPWCALKDSAYCFQLYNLPGIKNVHSNFDRQFRQRYTQGPDQWHHTVLTISLGTRLALFVDGKRVGLYNLSGRPIRPDDALHTLVFAQHNNRGLRIDELTILDLALDDAQVPPFTAMLRSLKATGHL